MMFLKFWLLFAVFALGTAEDGKLIFAQVLFRHGARAPSASLSNDSFIKYFPRGLGQLTDQGFENTYLLGKYLENRYVTSGFLDQMMKPSEMYWRSVNINRCLSSAATVGGAMFEKYNKHVNVPVSTNEDPDSEFLLGYNENKCYRETELVREKCTTYVGPEAFSTWPDYEEFIYRCLNFSHSIIDEFRFAKVESFLNEYKNGLKLPDVIESNIKEISKIFTQVTQYITGTGLHHDPRMMKLKFGTLTSQMIKNIEKAAFCHKNGCGKPSKKFIAYSTQDWILMGVLDAFGVMKESTGFDDWPEYNSMIINELWERVNGELEVKFYYKKEEVTQLNHTLIDVTSFVRNCPQDGASCPVQNFTNCCEIYREHHPGVSCRPLNPGNVETSTIRRKRFAGPS